MSPSRGTTVPTPWFQPCRDAQGGMDQIAQTLPSRAGLLMQCLSLLFVRWLRSESKRKSPNALTYCVALKSSRITELGVQAAQHLAGLALSSIQMCLPLDRLWWCRAQGALPPPLSPGWFPPISAPQPCNMVMIFFSNHWLIVATKCTSPDIAASLHFSSSCSSLKIYLGNFRIRLIINKTRGFLILAKQQMKWAKH